MDYFTLADSEEKAKGKTAAPSEVGTTPRYIYDKSSGKSQENR